MIFIWFYFKKINNEWNNDEYEYSVYSCDLKESIYSNEDDVYGYNPDYFYYYEVDGSYASDNSELTQEYKWNISYEKHNVKFNNEIIRMFLYIKIKL